VGTACKWDREREEIGHIVLAMKVEEPERRFNHIFPLKWYV
jgi:hypothetical protein